MTAATTHLIQFSTGAASAEIAWRVAERYGPRSVICLTADTLVEDDDNWRFARQVIRRIGCQWVQIADGRTPMQVGRDERVVPNNRLAVCSRKLKREILRRWIDTNCDPESTVIYLGFDWTEPHRFEAAKPHWQPYTVAAPLIDPPLMMKDDILELFRQRGIEPPRLYEQGFQHANCGGACVRGGQAQWALLLKTNPRLYREWEAEEMLSRAVLGKDVSILRDRRGGPVKPLPLVEFRRRLECGSEDFDHDDWGACSCLAPDVPE